MSGDETHYDGPWEAQSRLRGSEGRCPSSLGFCSGGSAPSQGLAWSRGQGPTWAVFAHSLGHTVDPLGGGCPFGQVAPHHCHPAFFFFFLIFFSTFIYFWDRERQSMNGGGAEREGDTESETGSKL